MEVEVEGKCLLWPSQCKSITSAISVRKGGASGDHVDEAKRESESVKLSFAFFSALDLKQWILSPVRRTFTWEGTGGQRC